MHPPASAGTRPRRRGLVLLATVLGCLITAALGRWQLDRAAQKQALQQQLEQRQQLPELPASALARSTAEAEAQHQRSIRLRGRWRDEATVYLDNRSMDGRTGFLVITPLLLADGDAIAVQRGWVPRHRSDRTLLPPIQTAGGAVELHGRLAPPPSALFDLGRISTRPDAPDVPASGPIRQNLALDSWARELQLPLRPLTLLQLDDDAATDGLLRHWAAPAANVQKHYGYAAQWFALSALIAGLHVWFQILRPRRQPRAR